MKELHGEHVHMYKCILLFKIINHKLNFFFCFVNTVLKIKVKVKFIVSQMIQDHTCSIAEVNCASPGSMCKYKDK